MQLHDSFVMVPLENFSLHLHFTLFYIISSPSSSCTSLLYSFLTIPYSHAPLQCLHHFHCSILPSILSSCPLIYLSLFFCSSLLPPHSFSLSLCHTLYSIPTSRSSPSLSFFLSISLSPFIYLFISTSLPTSLPNFHFLYFTLYIFLIL